MCTPNVAAAATRMTRELEDGGDGVAVRHEETVLAVGALQSPSLMDAEEDGEDDDEDFELETMEDDEEDDDDDDDDDDEDDGEFHFDDELEGSMEADSTLVGDLIDAAMEEETIAHRTRTKLSLVDVELDTLESLLPPDHTDGDRLPALRDGDEYQRFLSSLLPTVDDDDNLSFLDEEGEEYRPDEEDDFEEEEDDDDNADGAKRKSDRRRTAEDDDEEDPDQSVRVSKKELTELLWDSTMMNQVKVPPTFPKTTEPTPPSQVAGASAITRDLDEALASNEPMDTAALIAELKKTHSPSDTISQVQCIQLASQMHKHFQLLLQTYHLIMRAKTGSVDQIESDQTSADDGDKSATQPNDVMAVPTDEQLNECEQMLRDLQIRGKRALEHKARLLSRLSNSEPAVNVTTSERLEQRRVTRSISAAHAAVAHPSMFDIVGSQSMEKLTATFQHNCSVSDRNQAMQKSMMELDKHLLLSRKKKRPRGPKSSFTASEDRLLLLGVKRHGLEPGVWQEIQTTLVPTRPVNVLSKRYRYLATSRKRIGGGEFKLYHKNENFARTKAEWMIEEDVRIARGVLEFFGENRRFARVSGKYLPHRHRVEIRKRWEKLKEWYRNEDGSVIEVDADMFSQQAKDYVTVVKEFLENKLRARAAITAVELATQQIAKVTQKQRRRKSGDQSKAKKPPEPQPPPPPPPTESELPVVPSGCRAKNLHPALFFSSWAVINPMILLERTCEHNWPEFIEEKRKSNSKESTIAIVSQTAVSRVEEETAQHRADLASRGGPLPSIPEDDEESHDVSLDTIESNENEDEDDEDGEESEYEQEELMSSESEHSDDGHNSDSASEYEMMEMLDDDDEDDDMEEKGSPQHDHIKASRSKRAALERRLTGADRQQVSTPKAPPPVTPTTDSFDSFTVDENDLDLFAYEELSDSSVSNDDDFEQDELVGSSDEDDEPADPDTFSTTKRGSESPVAVPPKRAKTQTTTTRCANCGGAPCVCASDRMQRLMARMQLPKS